MANGTRVDGGRFVIESVLGVGATGEVYRAADSKLGRAVALKVVHRALLPTHNGIARAEREAALLARIDHPHVVALFDVVHIDGRLTLVLEYQPGGSLGGELRRAKLHLPEALRLGSEILDGLAAIHRAGGVHRDLKPENVLLDGKRRAKLADLGIARDLMDRRITQLDARLGTPGYMSPEQLHGNGEVDARSDLYCAGILLCELVAGSQPDHLGRPPLAEFRAKVADSAVIDRALRIEPGERWASATEMGQAWQQLAEAHGQKVTHSPPPAPATAQTWRLRVHKGPAAGDVVQVANKLHVGRADPELRAADNERLELDDRQASWSHCTFVVLADGGLVVYDDGSRNGTFVDGVRIGDGAMLRAGCVVRCGATELVVEAELRK